jgi:hypothetical protein
MKGTTKEQLFGETFVVDHRPQHLHPLDLIELVAAPLVAHATCGGQPAAMTRPSVVSSNRGS